jgi:hypothetical protein
MLAAGELWAVALEAAALGAAALPKKMGTFAPLQRR